MHNKRKINSNSYSAKIFLGAGLRDVFTLDKQDTVHYKSMHKQHFLQLSLSKSFHIRTTEAQCNSLTKTVLLTTSHISSEGQILFLK